MDISREQTGAVDVILLQESAGEALQAKTDMDEKFVSFCDFLYTLIIVAISFFKV